MTTSKPSRTRATFAALVALLLSCQPGLAQITVGGPVIVVPVKVEVEGPRLVVDFPVTAGPDAGLQLFLPGSLEPVEGNEPVAASWSRVETGAAEVAGAPVVLGPGAAATFRMEAILPDSTRYAARLILRRAGAVGGADQVLGPYVFARAPVPLPTEFLLATVHQRVTLWPWLPATANAAGEPLRVAIRGLNATERPIAIAGVAHGALTREGAEATITDLSFPVSAVSAGHTCGTVVDPGAFCTVELKLPALLGPGRYGLDVALSGAEGGVSMSRVTLEMRAPGWFAALVVALGAMVGAAVAHWREVDRPRALVELPLVRIADGFRRLEREADSREVVLVAREHAAEIDAALSQSRLGASAPEADPKALSDALRILRGAERGIAAVGASGTIGATVREALTALTTSLRADPWNPAATETALRKLEQVWAADQVQAAGKGVIRLESTEGTAQVALPTGQFLPVIGADAATYVQRISGMDLGTAFFMAGLIGLGGLAILWVGNPVWGSGVDILTAFSAGVATRLTLPSPVAKPLG